MPVPGISFSEFFKESEGLPLLVYHVSGEAFDKFRTPSAEQARNARSLFGHFFTTLPPKEGNLAGTDPKHTKVFDASDLKLFDWDAYGSGSWEQFSAGRVDKNFQGRAHHVQQTRDMLMRKGYDGIIVFESGYGNTVVVFDSALSKLKSIATESVDPDWKKKKADILVELTKNGHGIWLGSCGHILKQCRCKDHPGITREDMTITTMSLCSKCKEASKQHSK